MQIRTKLTIQFIVISATLLLTAFMAIYLLSAKFQKDEFFSRLEVKASTTADLLIRVKEVDSTLLKLIDLNKKDVLYHENISVYNSQQKEIYTNNDTIHFSKILPDFEQYLEDVRVNGKKKSSIGDIDIVGLPYTNQHEKFVVMACAIDKYGLNHLKNLRQILAIVFIAILVIVALSGQIYAARALKPISDVIRQVNTISANNLNQRINEGNKKDEIAQLTITFNHLLSRIEHAFTTQKTFVANASHELRNPLTAITSQLEVAILRERDRETYERVITSVLEDIKRLNEMSHRLLVLAKIDSDHSAFKLSPLRLDDLVWETKNEFLVSNPGCMVKLTLHTLPETEKQLTILGNYQFLKTCFLNLMDNACKFSPDHAVSIELFSDQKSIHVQFTDTGIGIDTEELPYIFEPFYRGRNTSHVNGYGVGLSIVDKIIHVHSGTIKIISELNQGTKFTLTFPLI